MADGWRFGSPREEDFESLLALRIDVMREHLERVFRYKASRARRIFREHFDEPGMRLILVGDEIIEISDADRHDDTPVFVVPAGHYFMMGDNRDNSLDSRIPIVEGGVGFVPEENLVARADRLLLSRDPSVGWLDVADWPHALRLARLFSRIE